MGSRRVGETWEHCILGVVVVPLISGCFIRIFFFKLWFPDLLQSKETEPGDWAESRLDVRAWRFRTQGNKNIKANRFKNIFKSGMFFKPPTSSGIQGEKVGGK